jgi:hypothetical protein
MANIIVSLTFLALSNNYLVLKWKFNFALWEKYDGTWFTYDCRIAFAINEQFDKILLGRLLPANIAEARVFCLL